MTRIYKAKTNLDIKNIAQLADIIWREHYIPIVGKPQIDYMLHKYQSVHAITAQLEAGFMYFLIDHDDTPVGYIAIKQEPQALFLSKIYVLNTCRGKGIGKKAMAFIEDKAKMHGLNTIRLTVNKYNTGSIKAYEKLGFKNIRPLVTDIGNGFIMDDYELIKTVE